MNKINQSAATEADRYKIRRGEPGQDIVTPLRDGDPVIENPPTLLGSSLPPSFSLNDEIARWRASLVLFFNEESAKKICRKRDFIKQFLRDYNRGSLLPEIYKKLGSISSPSLYRWMKAFADHGIDGLVPQYGGVGKSKITDHEKNILLALLLHQNRLKVAYAITLTKEFLAKRQIESPSSPATLRRFADQFEKDHYDIWVLHREGEKALNDKVLPYAERDWRLLDVGEGLVADGHRLNFQVINPETGKPCRAVLVLFWDWRSSYPLGWEIMLEENIQCVASALRNAIVALGKIPKWIYLDNGKAFKARIFTEDKNFEDSELPGMFARLNINYHFAQPYNAQSKPIERIFGILNEQLERMIPSYTGASINDKPPWTKRNEKLARSMHDSWVPAIPEAGGLIRAWRDQYAERPSRGRDGLRPVDIFNEGKGPGVDPAELVYLMMEGEIKEVHRNGVTWLGWHWSNEAMYGLKDKVVIRYSLSDLSQIFVFHKNEFLCAAKPIKPVHPMASESKNPKDMEAVKEGFRFKKKVKSTTRRLSDLLETKQASQIDWSRSRTPELAETIQRIEETKKPKVVRISPWPDEPEKIPIETHGSEDSRVNEASQRPSFAYDYEKWEWLRDHRELITVEDREWLADYKSRSSLFRESILDFEKELDRKAISDKEATETALKKSSEHRVTDGPRLPLIVDPRTGLSRPNDGTVFKNEFEYYDWYRSIEEKFPGILNHIDWRKIENYEASEEWEDFYGQRGYVRMARTVSGLRHTSHEPRDQEDRK